MRPVDPAARRQDPPIFLKTKSGCAQILDIMIASGVYSNEKAQHAPYGSRARDELPHSARCASDGEGFGDRRPTLRYTGSRVASGPAFRTLASTLGLEELPGWADGGHRRRFHARRTARDRNRADGSVVVKTDCRASPPKCSSPSCSHVAER